MNGLPIEVVDVDPGKERDLGYEDDHLVYMDISKAIQNTAVFSVLWRSRQLVDNDADHEGRDAGSDHQALLALVAVRQVLKATRQGHLLKAPVVLTLGRVPCSRFGVPVGRLASWPAIQVVGWLAD